MDARQFHHPNPVAPFVDVIDLCVDDVMKQGTLGISPRGEPGVSPRGDSGVSPQPAPAVGGGGNDGPAFVSYRLDQDDSAGSSAGSSGVQAPGFDPDPDVTAAADLCLSEAIQLIQRTGSPSGSDAFPALVVRHVGAGPRPSPGKCKVCGDEATGMYFGALVCVPCKVCPASYCNHRSVLNILDPLPANQIPAKGVVTIVCRIEIRKMVEC